jgi:hypothetical protein
MAAPVLPAPCRVDAVSGAVVWDGGIEVMGPLFRIPGRQLDASQLDEARQHVAAVSAAIAYLEALQ